MIEGEHEASWLFKYGLAFEALKIEQVTMHLIDILQSSSPKHVIDVASKAKVRLFLVAYIEKLKIASVRF